MLQASVGRHDLLAAAAEDAPADVSKSGSSDQKPEVPKDENAASLAVRMNALKALAAAWPHNALAPEFASHLDMLLDLLRKELDGSPQFTMRVTCLNAIKVIIQKLDYSANNNFIVSDSQYGGLLGTLQLPKTNRTNKPK